MTVTDLDNVSSRGGVEQYFKQATLAEAGYAAFWIPESCNKMVYIKGSINTAGEYKIEISPSTRAQCEAGTHLLADLWGANQTSDQDAQLELPGTTCVICTWVSGSATFTVRAL